MNCDTLHLILSIFPALALAKGPGVPEVFYFSDQAPDLLVIPAGETEPLKLEKQMLVQQLLNYNMQKLINRLKTAEQRTVIASEAGCQLMRTLQRIHTVGMLHCDLSLTNMMVGW
jgi:hypothetical protein